MTGPVRRRLREVLRLDRLTAAVTGRGSRPHCAFIGVYFDRNDTPVYDVCRRPAAFVMTRRCCGNTTMLCARHVKVARESEWTECQACQHIALSWEESATSLERIRRNR